MMKYIRTHLGAKLFMSYLVVILIATIVLVGATQFTAPTAYNRHLGMIEQMTEDTDMMGMMAGEQGSGQGLRRGQGSGFATELYPQFQESFSEALTWAVLVAGITALTVSIFLSKRLITPIRAMMSASQRIADGHFDERVIDRGADELGQLARSFNRMAGQLEQVENMRKQLIGDVAHELRTPLTAIKGSMEGLIDGILPESSETYQQIHQEAGRLSRLVEDLQELNRVEADTFDIERIPVNISSLIETIQKRFNHQIESNGIELIADIPADLPNLLADENRIIQVLTNLIDNAFRFTSKGGKVTIQAIHSGSSVQISVIDTGSGIPQEDLPHVFTRFYRVDKSRSRGAGGSGIGLTIAKHIVEAHEGQIWVESEGIDRGSNFTFTIPAA